MAKAELGVKRTCLSCNMRFYDFNRNPIICPGCGAEFDAEDLIKSLKNSALPKSKQKVEVPVTHDDSSDTIVGYEDDVDSGGNDDTDVDVDFDEDDIDDNDGPGIIPDDINDRDELLPNLYERED